MAKHGAPLAPGLPATALTDSWNALASRSIIPRQHRWWWLNQRVTQPKLCIPSPYVEP